MIAWLLKNPVLAAALAVCAALAIALGASRIEVATVRASEAKAAAAFAKANFDGALAQAQAERAARATEQRQREALAGVAATYEGKLTDAQRNADRTIADLRAGAVRVQRRLQCPSVTTSGGSAAPAGGPGDHDPAPTGLTQQDVEAALGIAADGDEAIVQLGACQAALMVYAGE